MIIPFYWLFDKKCANPILIELALLIINNLWLLFKTAV